MNHTDETPTIPAPAPTVPAPPEPGIPEHAPQSARDVAQAYDRLLGGKGLF